MSMMPPRGAWRIERKPIHPSAQKGNSPKSISSMLHIAAGVGAEDGLLPRPSTGGRPPDVGVLANYAPRCNIENTKRSELRFRAVLGDGNREVRFDRATV